MPIITCPDCKKQISDQATSCPHCGKPASSDPVYLSGTHVLVAILLPIVGVVLGLVMMANPKESKNGQVIVILSIILTVVYYVVWTASGGLFS